MTAELKSERIGVCVGPAPSSELLIRATAEMATALNAPWVAAYAERAMGAASDADRERLESHLRLAESLGGTVIRLVGSSVSAALIEHAHRHGITRLVIGKPTHSRWLDRIRGSLLDDVIRGSGTIDVHVISGALQHSRTPASRGLRHEPARLWHYGAAAVLVAGTTVLAGALNRWFSVPNLEGLYFVAVMLAAACFGRGPSILAAALAIATYDFFFVPPFQTFHVADARYLLTFAMMLAAGMLVSELAARIRGQEREALLRQERTAALYTLNRDLGLAGSPAAAARVVTEHAGRALDAAAFMMCPDANGALKTVGHFPSGVQPSDSERVLSVRCQRDHQPSVLHVEPSAGGAAVGATLRVGDAFLGVLVLRPSTSGRLGIEQREFLEALARQASFALERARLTEEAATAALRAEREQVRGSLLSAVSHDLRTPLAAITGAATSLRDDRALTAKAKSDLLEAICEEAERLERLVSNLLDMTRIESGAVALKREWVPLDEIIGSALTRLDNQLGSRPIAVELPDRLRLLHVDPLLLEQVFVNLLENAAKYTPSESPIEVSAAEATQCLEVDVLDRGPGLPAGSEERVFEKFHRGAHAGIGGIGLGLSICRWIVEAHGGSIHARNRKSGGAGFRITLPIAASQPVFAAAAHELRA